MKNRHLKYLSYSYMVDIYRHFRSQHEIETNKEDLTLTCHPSNPCYVSRTFSGYFKYALCDFLPFKQEELWEAWEINSQEEHECNVSYPQWLPREITEDVAYFIYRY